MFPLQVRFPFEPSTVQPVSVDPPAKLTLVAVVPVGPILIFPAFSNAATVVELVLNRFRVVADVPNVYVVPLVGLSESELADVIVAREPAVTVVALEVIVPLPVLRARSEVAPELIVPAPAKVRDVALTAIVSMDDTEESAPELITIPFIVLPVVGAVIAPPTFNVPATVVLPVLLSTVNLLVLTSKSPVTASVPPTVALLVTLIPVPNAVKFVVPENVLVEVPV